MLASALESHPRVRLRSFASRVVRSGISVVAALLVVLAAAPVVPAYMSAQSSQIVQSSGRHGIPAAWLAAVLYNEMLGTEDRILRQALPGDDALSRSLRQGLLGLDLLTLKQLHWGAKAAAALIGADPTIGPASLRVSVGREIRDEAAVVGGVYKGDGWAERPSMVMDLVSPLTAIEYLAGNLQRGQARLLWQDRGDWATSARWHNTGVIYNSAIVRPEDWSKGTLYVARVQGYLPAVTALLASASRAEQTGSPAEPVGAWLLAAWRGPGLRQ